MPNPYALAPSAVSQARPQVIYANVSTNKPAPTKPSDPLYVVTPQWDTDVYFTITEWPMCNGTTLPRQGDLAVLIVDSTRTMRCVYWQGTYTAGAASPLSFGASGDGTHDDTVAVQAAASSLTAGGGILDLGSAPVTYLISAPIVLPDKAVSVRGRYYARKTTGTLHCDLTCSASFVGLAALTHSGAVGTGSTVTQADALSLLGVSVDMTAMTGGRSDGIRLLGHRLLVQSCCIISPDGIGINLTDQNAGGYQTGGGNLNTDNAVRGNVIRDYGISGFVAGSYGQTAILSAGLSTNGAITTLPVAALAFTIPAGTITVYSGSHSQDFTTAGASATATSVPVSSVTPNFAYPIGSPVSNCVTSFASPNSGSGSTDAWFTDNFMVAAAQGAVSTNLGPAVAFAQAQDWWIRDNHIQHMAGDGLQLDNTEDARVAHNKIELFGQAGAAATTYHGILIRQLWGEGTVVTGNTVKANESTAAASTVYRYYDLSVNSASGDDVTAAMTDNRAYQVASGSATSLAFAVAGDPVHTRTLNVIGGGNVPLGPGGGIGQGTTALVSYTGVTKPRWIVPGHTAIQPQSSIGIPFGSPTTSFGTATTILSPLISETFCRLRGIVIHWTGTFGGGETCTLRLTFTYDDGATATNSLTQTSTGTQTPNATAFEPSGANVGYRSVLVQAQLKSSITGSLVTCNVDSSGDAGA